MSFMERGDRLDSCAGHLTQPQRYMRHSPAKAEPHLVASPRATTTALVLQARPRFPPPHSWSPHASSF